MKTHCTWTKELTRKPLLLGQEQILLSGPRTTAEGDDWPSPPGENTARRPPARQEDSFYQKLTPMAP